MVSYGWLCAECYDQLEAAWDYVLEHRDELVVMGGDGNGVTWMAQNPDGSSHR